MRKRLVLHHNWVEIGRKVGSIPGRPHQLQKEINNLYHFEEHPTRIEFFRKDYPSLDSESNWINSGGNTGGSIPLKCVKKIIREGS